MDASYGLCITHCAIKSHGESQWHHFSVQSGDSVLYFKGVVFRYNLCRMFGRPSHISSEFLGSEGVKIGSSSANSCIGCRATSKLLGVIRCSAIQSCMKYCIFLLK